MSTNLAVGRTSRFYRISGGAFMALLLLLCMRPARGAFDVAKVGFLDQGVVTSMPVFGQATAQLQREKVELDGEYRQAMHASTSAAAQRQLSAIFAQRFAQRQEALLGPLFGRGSAAIAEVATAKGLSIVVDRRIMIVGGTDITAAVIKRIGNPHPIVPPAHPLPAASIGYVDEQQLNAVPQVKLVNARYAQAQQSIESAVTADIRRAKTEAQRAQIIEQAQNAQAAKEHEFIDPMVAQMQHAMAQVATHDGLALVVDKTAVFFGGRDVTKEVIGILK